MSVRRIGPDLDELLDMVATDLATYGVTYVPVEGEEYVYTVGLTNYGMPELLVDRQSRATDDRADYGDVQLQYAFLKPVAEWAARQDSLSADSQMAPADHDPSVSYWVGFEEVDPAILRVPRAFYRVEVRALRARRRPLPAQ